MAEIVAHSHCCPVTNATWRTYEWIGPLSECVRIDYWLERQIPEMPFPLELKKFDPLYGSLYFRNDVSAWYAWHRLLRDLDAAKNYCLGVRNRFILTLIVWGMGSIVPGEVIGWQCLRRKRN